ncbi:MAG: helix-turn-helix domain-containing protein [Bdellovibrionales bacterium]|nr:helix-turn-helix domain-containing protein [Bdellovibrionales bacterium]
MVLHEGKQTYYEVLEITPSASREEIMKAYQKAKGAYSPNSPALYSVFSKEEADQLLRIIDEAYSVLVNQDKRREYDQNLIRTGAVSATGVISHPNPFDTGVLSDFMPAEPFSQNAQGDDLPDFAIPTVAKVNLPAEKRNAIQEAATTIRGRMPQYSVNAVIEAEIQNQTVFDGPFLAKIREYKGVSHDLLSEITRIGRHYLVALENNNFPSLPASVFVRGFVTQVARCLGLNEKKVVESYMKLYKDARGGR